MKTLWRIVAIVAVSLVVIGGSYAYVQYGGNTLLATGPGGGERGAPPEGFEGGTRPQRGDAAEGEVLTPQDGQSAEGALPPGDFDGEEGFGRGGGREGGREGGSLMGLGEVFKNIAVMSVITLIVVALGMSWRFISRRFRRPTAAVSPPAP
jgi:hypothetical protein